MINVQVIKIRYGFVSFSMAFRESSIVWCLFYRLVTFFQERNAQFLEIKFCKHLRNNKSFSVMQPNMEND